jgi:SOS-response transcriptional repressor LexA
MLTPKQRDVLLFIHEYTEQHRVSPTFREISEEMGFKGLGHVHDIVEALIDRGFIRRRARRARALSVIKLPPGGGTLQTHTPDLIATVKRLVKFAEDAPTLDFSEDRTISWIAVVTANARDLLAKVEK